MSGSKAAFNVFIGFHIACPAYSFAAQSERSAMRCKMLFELIARSAATVFNMADRVALKFRMFHIVCVWNDLYAYVAVSFGKVRVYQILARESKTLRF